MTQSMAFSRRRCLQGLASAVLAEPPAVVASNPIGTPPEHERRIRWWREAKFGMFVHWGLYSMLGREAWAQAIEDIPPDEYAKLADRFAPAPNVGKGWARLARAAGMKYIVPPRSITRASASSIRS